MKYTLLASALIGAASLTHAAGFTLSSPDIKAGGMIAKSFEFNGFGCAGENQSPALKWSGAPKATKAFAVTVYDPDAPTGSGWWHWIVINIPAEVTELAANAGAVGGANLPKGATPARIDFGVAGWGGVCPPEGDKPHRYRLCPERQARSSRRRHRRADRLHDQRQQPGQGQLYCQIRAAQGQVKIGLQRLWMQRTKRPN
jgi:Raf kinase inhibitor-like YbhB/YbcL family protein